MSTSLENATATSSVSLNTTVHESTDFEWFWYVEIVYLAMTFIFGTTGNALVIMVELTNKTKYSTDYLIISLTLFEMLCSTLGAFMNFVNDTPAVLSILGSTASCQLFWFVIYTSGITSTPLLSAIAVDRYIHTCKPFAKWYSIQIGRRLAIGISAAGIVVCFPCIFGVYADDDLNCVPTDTRIDLVLYDNFLNAMTVVPFFVTVVSYILVGRGLRQRNLQSQAQSSQVCSSDQVYTRGKSYSRWTAVYFRIMFRIPNKTHPLTKIEEGINKHQATKTGLSGCTRFMNLSSIPAVTTDSNARAVENTSGPLTNQLRSSPATTTGVISQIDNTTTGTVAESYRLRSFRQLQKSELMRRTTVIMFLITLTYAVTYLFGWILFVPVSDQAVELLLFRLSRLVTKINCVANPFYMFLLSSKFRQSAKKILLRN